MSDALEAVRMRAAAAHDEAVSSSRSSRNDALRAEHKAAALAQIAALVADAAASNYAPASKAVAAAAAAAEAALIAAACEAEAAAAKERQRVAAIAFFDADVACACAALGLADDTLMDARELVRALMNKDSALTRRVQSLPIDRAVLGTIVTRFGTIPFLARRRWEFRDPEMWNSEMCHIEVHVNPKTETQAAQKKCIPDGGDAIWNLAAGVRVRTPKHADPRGGFSCIFVGSARAFRVEEQGERTARRLRVHVPVSALPVAIFDIYDRDFCREYHVLESTRAFISCITTFDSSCVCVCKTTHKVAGAAGGMEGVEMTLE